MKKIIFISVMFLLSFSVFSQTLKIGYFQLEPYVIPDPQGGPPTGIVVEFWEEYLAQAMGVQLEWIGPYPFPRLERMLETGELDTVFIMIKTPPREAKFLFPSEPFFYMQPGLTILKEDPMPPLTSLEDIYGLKLGYIEGANLPPYLINDNIILDRSSQTDYKMANFQKLLRKRIDAILDLNMLSNRYEAQQRGLWEKFRMVPLPVDPTPMYTCFAQSSQGQIFLNLYVNNIQNIPENAIYDIIDRYSE